MTFYTSQSQSLSFERKFEKHEHFAQFYVFCVFPNNYKCELAMFLHTHNQLLLLLQGLHLPVFGQFT